jgi:prepilin-type N-terminal cleavage/methylation domain-containing protein
MKRVGRGFTIIELMIAMAISAMMLTSAIVVFNNRKATTQFSQSMYDLQSKIQSYAGQVSSKALPGYQEYTCAASATTNRPALTQVAASANETTGESCIYLGRAIQVIPGGDTIYAYPVFGFRTIHNGAVDTGEFPNSISQATPEPVLNSPLVDSYFILNGLTVVSAGLVGDTNEHDLLTIYSSLQNNNTSGNQVSVSAVQKTFTAADINADSLKACIEGSGCSLKSLNSGATWQLCLTDGSAKQAQIRLKGTSTGISTKLNMDGCPAT